jgi:hypothetical protein
LPPIGTGVGFAGIGVGFGFGGEVGAGVTRVVPCGGLGVGVARGVVGVDDGDAWRCAGARRSAGIAGGPGRGSRA